MLHYTPTTTENESVLRSIMSKANYPKFHKANPAIATVEIPVEEIADASYVQLFGYSGSTAEFRSAIDDVENGTMPVLEVIWDRQTRSIILWAGLQYANALIYARENGITHIVCNIREADYTDAVDWLETYAKGWIRRCAPPEKNAELTRHPAFGSTYGTVDIRRRTEWEQERRIREQQRIIEQLGDTLAA